MNDFKLFQVKNKMSSLLRILMYQTLLTTQNSFAGMWQRERLHSLVWRPNDSKDAI